MPSEVFFTETAKDIRDFNPHDRTSTEALHEVSDEGLDSVPGRLGQMEVG